jgi:hypothetical protein
MGWFMIGQPRGFGAAEIPTFESRLVYTNNLKLTCQSYGAIYGAVFFKFFSFLLAPLSAF